MAIVCRQDGSVLFETAGEWIAFWKALEHGTASWNPADCWNALYTRLAHPARALECRILALVKGKQHEGLSYDQLVRTLGQPLPEVQTAVASIKACIQNSGYTDQGLVLRDFETKVGKDLVVKGLAAGPVLLQQEVPLP